MDKRANNGGKREGAGRKGKAEEQKLIENLTPMSSIALESLQKGLKVRNNGQLSYSLNTSMVSHNKE